MSLTAVQTANARRLAALSQPLVAVVPGGTSGIAEYTIDALTKHAAAGQGAHIYIVGRNKSAADATTARHSTLTNVVFHFVKVEDLSLLKNVKACCDELKTLLQNNGTPRIDLLLMSAADLHVGPRRDTSEGMDKSFALLYYSRIYFTTELLPLLEATLLPSARVISIFAGGMEVEKNFRPDDLSLRDPKNFGFAARRNHVVHMKTMSFETIAQQHPKVGLVHVFPGLVITPGFDNNPLPTWFKVAWVVLGPIARLTIALKPPVIAEWVLGFTSERYGGTAETATVKDAAKATNGVIGGGAYSAKYDGTVYSDIAAYKKLRPERFQEKVWQHTQSAFQSVEQGKKFEQ